MERFVSPPTFFDHFVFFSMKTTPNKMISTHLERYEKRLQFWYRGKFDPKRKVHTLKGKCKLIGLISQI